MQISPIEIALGEEGDHAGLAEADLTVQSEQRAMQEWHRFQKHSMPTTQTEGVESASVQAQPTAAKAAQAAQDACCGSALGSEAWVGELSASSPLLIETGRS